MKEWQESFEVRGLVAPRDGMLFDDLLFRRAKRPDDRTREESDDLSLVFFKKSGEEPNITDFERIRSTLERILYFYGLVVGRYCRLPDQASASGEITESSQFGSLRSMGTIDPSVVLREEQLAHYTDLLRATIKMFRKFGFIFETSSMTYLKNSVVYYYKALDDLSDLRLEEALIDLIISLESLLGDEPEIRYRMALRTSTLLSIKDKEQRFKRFNQVYDLGKKRNQIVHGKGVSLEYNEVFDFSKTVRSVILILLNFNKTRKEITTLIDDSILKHEKEKELEILFEGHLKTKL